ncbi:MAG: hypothetical protein A2032_01485 [Chloroflexi bacterium RBG_19FT_COMBO_49_13]|nr:MAG: hypothetical protein A2032_01485 [Chloroflexi bacterium RBG_19FT_COMBO_49_13]
MKKRTVIAVITVVGLLIVAFVSGSVFAQLDLTSSSTGDSNTAPLSTGVEAAPGAMAQAGGEMAYSTVDGKALDYIAVDVNESEFHVATIDGPVPSSNSSDTAPVDGSYYKVEPMITKAETVPDAPTYNSTLRFVGSTLRPRTNDVNYGVTGGGGCVNVIVGNALSVWNLPLALPSGTQVEWLRMYYYDNDAATTMYGWFTKYDLYGNLVQEWAIPSATSGYNYTDVEITPAEVINYSLYSYVINWRPVGIGTDLRLCGFRLFTTVWGYNFIPMINKR